MTPQAFYRYDSYPVYESRVRVYESQFKLLKETPCGYWIVDRYYRDELVHWTGSVKKWVSKTSRKRFAYPTKEEAMTSFKARKNRQISILKYQIKNAEQALAYADIDYPLSIGRD